MKKAGKTLIVIAVIAILMVLSGSFYTTMENEYSVVKQFGRIVQTNDTAGLRVKVPFVQTVSYVPKALQVYDLPQSEVITSDKKTMIVDAYVLWDVTDAKAYTQTLNASASTAQGRIDVIVYNAIKTTISSMTQEELIASRDNSVRIETTTDETDDIEIKDIEAQELDEDGNVIKSSDKEVEVIVISDLLEKCIGDQCDQYGIEISDVKIKVLDLPDENKEAVYNRMITERNNIAAAYKAQGESEAQIIRNTTDKEVSVMLSEAQAKADATVAEGEAEYMRILSEAYNDEGKADFYLFSLQLDTLKESVTNGNTTVFLDKNSPIAQIFEGVN
ncbi:MAG: protease modulator HflC [Lachnospiraceae bacterium]|nr:protease modulator HflC [Lachnospiraceae bacterium]MDD5853231.1 protease modulator HflC [Lachnospiraceae bacterium]